MRGVIKHPHTPCIMCFFPLARNELPFLELNVSSGIMTEEVGHFDDGASHAIRISGGFPFDGTRHDILYVCKAE